MLSKTFNFGILLLSSRPFLLLISDCYLFRYFLRNFFATFLLLFSLLFCYFFLFLLFTRLFAIVIHITMADPNETQSTEKIIVLMTHTCIYRVKSILGI